MKRESVSAPGWRDWIGVVVTVASALLLTFVLLQASSLGRDETDRRNLEREGLAVARGSDAVAAILDVTRLREAVAEGASPAATRGLRTRLDAQFARLDSDYRFGPASVLGVTHAWSAAENAWRPIGRTRAPAATIVALDRVAAALQAVIDSMEDASNLTYDPSALTQNLGDVAFTETPRAIEAAARSRVVLELAARNGRMRLRQRLQLANITNAIRGLFDLGADNVPWVARQLAALLPARAAEFERFPASVVRYDRAGSRLTQVLTDRVLQANIRQMPIATVRADAAVAVAQAASVNRQAFAALDASLVERARLQARRNSFWYAALLIGAILLIGLMMTGAQLFARRARIALREAQQQLARQRAEEALRLSEAQFRAVFDGAALGIAIVDRAGSLVDANDVFRSMFGDDIGGALHGYQDEFADVLSGKRDTFEFEQHLRPSSGGDLWIDVTVSVVRSEDDLPFFAICMLRDKTALKYSERRMLHDKTHDALTGLPNRRLFEDHLNRRFDEAQALLDSFFAVLFIDLEHFKDVNESLGHAAGDIVLNQIAKRLCSSVDARDIVARLGNDEFAVLIQSLGDILHVESIARRILTNVSKAIGIESRTIYLSASIGIAIGSAGYERAEDVMRDAEIAMQNAKTSAGTHYALFDSKMHDRAKKRLQFTSDIRLALERREFHLLYQPIVTIEGGALVGCEALIRWDHPVEGTVQPLEFMPIAERCGLAGPIGRFVLQTASEQLASWTRNRRGVMSFVMHVNVSAAELLDPDFEQGLVQIVEQNGLAPQDLIIEITESVVLDSGTRANLTIERVRQRGFNICIDDFGTGYSSLRYLQQFKVDAIKIDHSFVAGPDGDLASEPIVRTLMTLAEAFDVRVVAEGVETERQRRMLHNAGCQLAQGFLFAHPLSAAEMVRTYPQVLGRVRPESA